MATTNCGILLAEDDRIDAKAFVRALHRLGIALPVTVARDGVEAWALIDGPTGLRPRLVVVDINMPRLNGLELARRIRAHPELRDTPVYVLTTSDAGPDRTGAFQLGVSGYLLKSELPAGLGRIFQAARPAA